MVGVSAQPRLDPNILIPGTYYRYALYQMSSIGGRVYRFFMTGWRPLVLWLLVSFILILAITAVAGPGSGESADAAAVSAETSAVPAGGVIPYFNAETAVAAGLLFVLGFVMFKGHKSRRQVVVGAFTNNTNLDYVTHFSDGLSSLLTNELHSLRSLYSEVDDRRAIASVGGRKGPLDYAIMSGEAGDSIENLISSTDMLEIGPFIKFPVGAVAGVFSKFFSGPQIIGSFHRDDDLVVLTAFMSGPQSHSWRVQGRIVSENKPDSKEEKKYIPGSSHNRTIPLVKKQEELKNLDFMVKELAYRIFTDLTDGGTTEWRATLAFTEGLKNYRNCLLSRKDQLRNLKNAKRRFLEAISEDDTFDLAWYNLGVVYTELENRDAADKAFSQAIKMKPELWEPYYALALNRFNKILDKEKYVGLDEHAKVYEELVQEVISPCKQALELNPKNPDLHILIGVCYRILAIQKKNPENEVEISAEFPDLKSAISNNGKPAETDDMTSGKTMRMTSESRDLFGKAAVHHSYAVSKAWHDLCASRFRLADEVITRKSDVRKVCCTALWDLARTYYAYAVCERGAVSGESPPALKFRNSLPPIESVLLQGLSIDQTNTDILYSLGTVYYTKGNIRDALDCFESATRIDPINAKYWLLLALTAHKAHNISRRDTALGKVLEYPSGMRYLPPRWKCEVARVLPWEGLSSDLRAILDFQEESRVNDYLNIVRDTGKWPKTEDDILKLIDGPLQSEIPRQGTETDPDFIRRAKGIYLAYHMARSFFYDDTGKSELYNSAMILLKKMPSSRWENWVEGMICYECAQYSDPSENYCRAYKNFYSYPLEITKKRIDQKMIEFLVLKGKINEARECASKNLRKNPHGYGELFAWGKFLSTVKDFKGALSAFESALFLKPYDVDALSSIGSCYRGMGDYYHTREEKENSLRQAIRYFEEAREVLESRETKEILEHQDTEEQELINRQKARFRADSFRKIEKILNIYLNLGECYFDLTGYGKAIQYYNLAMKRLPEPSSYPSGYPSGISMKDYCTLKCGEALLQKRDHHVCEHYFSQIIDKFKNQVAQEFYVQPFMSPLGDVTYAGEIYIGALLGLAYSLAERDIDLDNALELVNRAEKVLDTLKIKSKDQISGLSGKGSTQEFHDSEALLQTFLERIRDIEAEIYDKRGWIYYKQTEKIDKAEKELRNALSRKASPDYYFHLAWIYETLSRETEKDKKINAGLALAYCDHALDMAPNLSLQAEVKKLMDKISQQQNSNPSS